MNPNELDFLKKRVTRLEGQVQGLVGQLAYTNELIQKMAQETARIAEGAGSAIEVLERLRRVEGCAIRVYLLRLGWLKLFDGRIRLIVDIGPLLWLYIPWNVEASYLGHIDLDDNIPF